jgi:DNA-binding LacI/PurR family transcriptional regulator
VIRSGGFRGVVILPGPDADARLQRCLPAVPCIFTDIVPEDIPIQSVCPDYHQAMSLALLRLRISGFKKPGLMLDAGLSLLACERLLSAYCAGLGTKGTFGPPAFFTPTRTASSFETWLTRHSFDALISTDEEQATRLLPDDVAVPVFGLHAGQPSRAGGIDFNFATVGRHAVETLHRRLVKGGDPCLHRRSMLRRCGAIRRRASVQVRPSEITVG